MKILLLFILSVFMVCYSISQNNFPKMELNNITKNALNYMDRTFSKEISDDNNNAVNGPGDFISRFNKRSAGLNHHPNANKSGDTLFIGLVPGDSLYITGEYSYDGTVVVWGDGKLVFENANATIFGDLLVFGNTAHVWISNSVMHFPQSFVYERGIIAGMNGIIEVYNSTFDYYGLSHDLTLTDSALITWNNVTNIGFTTCGLSLNSQIIIDSTNQAGEYIMKDNATASFSNAHTLLVWHHIPETGILNFTFPDGTSIASLDFDGSLPGLTNINYSYQISNVEDVMWGLMPEPGSSVEITDSELRTVGVWFKNLPDYQVSGLVNNSHYTDFTAPISSHNIHLINTDVQTWSLYMFDDAFGEVDNCILGEVGTMVNSTCTMNNSLVDGSGGYLFANDNTILTSAFSYLNCNFQSGGNAFGIMAYGGQNMGRCIAFDKSVMMIIQANLIYNPEIYGDAMVYYLKLEGNSTEYANSIVPVSGAAYIEHASDYYSNDVGWYFLEYCVGSSEIWFPASDTVYGNEVFSGHLCDWNTEGLAAGNYTLKLTMCDNTPEQNKVEAVRQYNLIPLGTGISQVDEKSFNIFPNPVKKGSELSLTIENAQFVRIFCEDGKLVSEQRIISGLNTIKADFQQGIYMVEFLDRDHHGVYSCRVVVE